MNEKSTTDLLYILNNLDSVNDMNLFLDEETGLPDIAEYFENFFKNHKLTKAEVQKNFTGYYDKSYFYKITGGRKKNPARDIVITLCLACHMNRKGTRRTLELFGLSDLYPRSARDAIIAININKENFSIDDINEQLAAYNEEVLGNIK